MQVRKGLEQAHSMGILRDNSRKSMMKDLQCSKKV